MLLGVVVLALVALLPGGSCDLRKSRLLVVKPAEFHERVMLGKGSFYVMFHHQSCIHCQNLLPALTKAADTVSGSLNFALVDTTGHPEFVEKHGIREFPRLMVYVDGHKGLPATQPGWRSNTEPKHEQMIAFAIHSIRDLTGEELAEGVQSPDVQTFSGTPVHEPTPAVRRSRSGEAGRASGNPKLKVALTPDDYKRERQQPDFGEDDPDLVEDVPSGFAGLPAMDAVVKEVSTPTIRVEGVEIGPGVRINNRASSDEAAEGDNQSATVADADDEDEDEGEEGEEEEELAEWEVHERKRRAAQERRKAAGINDEDLYDDYDEFIRELEEESLDASELFRQRQQQSEQFRATFTDLFDVWDDVTDFDLDARVEELTQERRAKHGPARTARSGGQGGDVDGDAEWAFRDGDDLPAEVFDDMVMNKLRRMHRDEIDEEDEEDEETSSVAGDRRGGAGHVEEDEDDDLDLDDEGPSYLGEQDFGDPLAEMLREEEEAAAAAVHGDHDEDEVEEVEA